MAAAIRRSAFDSDMLGLQVGKAAVEGLDRPTAEALAAELAGTELDVVFIRDTKFAFERAAELPWGALDLADVKVSLSRDTHPTRPGSDSSFAVSTDVALDDARALLPLTRSIARLSRFHRCFGEAAAFRVYDAWLRNALAREAADWCVVARAPHRSDPAGFIAVKRDGISADLPLVATADEYRGRGVLRLMMAAVLRRLEAEGVKRCTVSTQLSNAPAVRAYQALGFGFEGTLVDLHMRRIPSR
jgi:GNAT superfamily N-acetyltransferase